jgi:sugar (pentulose or hexulose) kinase
MYLGLDLGTTRVKAIIVDKEGKITAESSAPVQTYPVADNGIEQDIEEIFHAALQSIVEITSATDASRIEAIGVSSQGGALQILDGAGNPVGRVISWLDGRGRLYDDQITREFGFKELARITGHGRGKMSLGQLLRLSKERPELLAPPNLIGFAGDVIVARLCGRRAHDVTSLSCPVLLNPRTGAAEPKILNRIGIREDQLPDLISPRQPAGNLLTDIAEKTSLPAHIPVSPAVHDQYAAALSVGASHASDVMFGTGTAWVLLAVADRLVLPVTDDAFVCTHLIEPLYGQILSLGNGGSSIDWALDILGLSGLSYDKIDALLEATTAGSEGLRFFPLLSSAGGAGLDPNARGQLAGLRLSHTRDHILRAVVEGLAMELNRHLEFLLDADVSVTRLIMCGGAASSRVTPQIISDVAGLPVDCVTETSTSALGAAIIGRGLIDSNLSLAEIASVMMPSKRTWQPGKRSQLYQKMFQEYVESLTNMSSRRAL